MKATAGAVVLSVLALMMGVEGAAASFYPSRGLAVPRVAVARAAVAVPSPAARQQVADTTQADGAPGDSIPPDAIPADTIPADTIPPPDALEDFFGGFTDLGVRFRGRMEMGGEWNRFRPCDAAVQNTCDPGLFPQLRPDVQFGVDVGGDISQRIHVDVDYDETREFSATNNVNVYYEGLPGELIQRLEVGDVSFDLPRSRFLTQGIPAGNFGFRADARIRDLRLETVWAEQSGEVSTRTLRLEGAELGGSGFVQQDTLVVDDADYVRGQFFFLVDPAALAGYPHIDALALSPSDAPPTVSPGPEPVQLYRFEADPVTRQQVEGYIQAEAVAGSGVDEVRESGWFRYLQPGVDYVIHSSGLWITLRRPLTREEMLAVTYVTAAGDTVGTYDPERVYNQGGQPVLQLLKASGASHRPGGPTWEREMHQVYRVSSSSDVDPESVELTVSLGELSAGRTFKRGPRGRDLTFLRLFGMDEQSPVDELDRTGLYLPAEEYLLDQPPVSGAFLVFPTLEPFFRPPPLPSEGLSADETALVLGADANPRIYQEPDFFERREAGLFRLTIPFRIRSTGGISSFSLGALGVRDGSERIYLGDRLLVRGVDYTIDYTIGSVTLLNPDLLFTGRPDAELRATWEQKQVFRLAPTSVVGLRGHHEIGDWGGIDVLGLYQTEDALVNRPTLGVEPAAVTLGGVNTDLSFGATWLDDFLGGIPGLRPGEASTVDVRGELAVSVPDPNTAGAVYIDDFDGSQDRTISLESDEWVLGSAPTSRMGAEDVLPTAVDVTTHESLTWQHTWVVQTAAGDSIGVFQGFLPSQDIDRQINVVGSRRREPGMLLTFGDQEDPPFAETRWRSITTLLGPSGVDLSRSEFLEFYVAQGDSLTLIVDLGEVSEDALFVDPAGNVNGVKESTGEPWGLGILDQEADPRQGEIWSDVADQRGVWGEECLAQRARIYRIGDPRANCTRGNGFRDTEDLDENGSLNLTERHQRYVIRLDGSSPYLAKTREETG
ncbi:MAG: hypothetical protein R3223_07370, partial [Longimicrobiales bacterium]|nr:hypothetical protein [Longimicrobiales bacterium]